MILATILYHDALISGCKLCIRVWVLGEKLQVGQLIDLTGLLECYRTTYIIARTRLILGPQT
jgi:hypothetical protein